MKRRPRGVAISVIAAIALLLVSVVVFLFAPAFLLEGIAGYFIALALGAVLIAMAVYLVATAGGKHKDDSK